MGEKEKGNKPSIYRAWEPAARWCKVCFMSVNAPPSITEAVGRGGAYRSKTWVKYTFWIYILVCLCMYTVLYPTHNSSPCKRLYFAWHLHEKVIFVSVMVHVSLSLRNSSTIKIVTIQGENHVVMRLPSCGSLFCTIIGTLGLPRILKKCFKNEPVRELSS